MLPPRFEASRFDSYQAETPSQERALNAAQAFVERAKQKPSLFARLRHWLPGFSPAPPLGLYLVGPAGTGKTHLMAAAYHQLPVPCAFVHSSRLFRVARRPAQLARRLAREKGYRVVMIDEVELDDAANEARLAQFLRALTQENTALMATSNARPDEFVARRVSDGNRHRRFLNDALAGRCEVVVVEGADRRQVEASEDRGGIFVGPSEDAEAVLRRACEADDRNARWLRFEELRRASTETAHERLMEQLLQYESLYVANVALRGTDDALRLLRLIDDLYVAPDAPALYFSAEEPPENWFVAGERSGVAGGIAAKFTRTVSRLRELCAVRRVETERAA